MSIAANPAYRSQPTARSKAKPDRTIFGTSLDNFDRCKSLLQNKKVLKQSDRLFDSKLEKAWTKRGTSSLELQAGANWEIKKYYQRNSRGGSKVNTVSTSSRRTRRSQATSERSRNRSRNSVVSTPSTSTSSTIHRPRIMDLENNQRPPGGGVPKQQQLPKYRMKPGLRNYMQISSMKITESGAKDLMNSQPVNKVGLGETLQYNYQAHKVPDTPKMYGCHGHAMQLGQKFNADTTNGDETAPGGFYRLATAQKDINRRYEWKHNRYTEDTIAPHHNKAAKVEDPIPANIRAKFRRYGGDQILEANKQEVQYVLNNKEYLNYDVFKKSLI